jgi:hypothetical protein
LVHEFRFALLVAPSPYGAVHSQLCPLCSIVIPQLYILNHSSQLFLLIKENDETLRML